MNFDVRESIFNAIAMLVKPVIRLALRNGITYRQFSDMCRGFYIDVAASDYGVQGRATNISRIALMTGINRKDIKKIRDAFDRGEPCKVSHAPDRISRILTAWYTDEDFASKEGVPKVLPVKGAISFTELVRRYGGDIAVVTLLKEFKHSNVIEETSSGNMRVLKRYFVPNPPSQSKYLSAEIGDPKPIMHASSILNDHINTIFHNLYRKETELPARFERRATNHLVDQAVVGEFHKYVAERGQQLLEEVDDWLSDHQVSENNINTKRVRLGLGTYLIEGPDQSV